MSYVEAKNLPMRGNVTSGMDRLHNMPRGSIYRTTTQAIATGTLSALVFDTVEYDTDGMTPQSTQALYIRTAGLYYATASVRWAAGNGAGIRQIYIRKSGSVVFPPVTITDQFQIAGDMVVGWPIQCLAGEYLEAMVTQTSGLSIDVLAATSVLRQNGLTACMISTL